MASSIQQDQMLLKRCHDGDKEAQNTFAEISYYNEVSRTVHEVMVHFSYILGQQEKSDLVKIIVRKVYTMWEDLPEISRPLRKCIRDRTMAITFEYLKKKAKI
jgi:hypothetical protein